MSSNDSVPATSWSPSKARHEFRTSRVWEGRTSSGLCRGYLQANLAVLPSLLADQFETFCNLNRAPCPLLYRSKPGEVSAGHLARDSDIRTDLLKYCVSENGILTKEINDLTAYPWDDFVSFYLGCSFSFEDAIIAAGIPIHNIAENRQASMYRTNIPCIPVDPFSCNMVVSMRLFPRELVEKVVVITVAYDFVHGAPIHIGDPSTIGIKDIGKTDFGQPPDLGELADLGNLVPVFWACGATSSLAVRSACPKLSFNHSPGSMFICDTTLDEYLQNHGSEHGDEKPRLVILSDQPFLASLCSASALLKVEELATNVLHGPSSNLLKIALRLSHAPSVVIGFVGEQESLSCDTSRSDHIQGLLALVKALQVLKKKVTLVTEHSATLLNSCLSSDAAKGILKGAVRIVESDNTEMKGCLFEGEINDRLDTIVTLQSERERVSQSDEKEFLGDWVDKLLQGVTGCKDRIVMVKIMARNGDARQGDVDTGSVDSPAMTTPSLKVAGHILAAALYVLNQCPIHSRYVRRGLGKRETFQVEQFLPRSIEQGEDLCHRIATCIQEDHIKA